MSDDLSARPLRKGVILAGGSATPALSCHPGDQ